MIIRAPSRARDTQLLLSGAALVFSLFLSTCRRDVTAPPVPTQLALAVQPTTTTAGHQVTPAVQVTALDASGNPVPGFAGNVTVALGTNPAGATLSGTTTVAAVNGVAAFGSLSINKSGTGYTLTATAAGLSAATSVAFDIMAGPATQLVFTVQPTTTTAGAMLAPAVQVTALDALGNVASGFTGDVTVALAGNSGRGTLAGTTTVAAVGGVTSFATLSVDKSATAYWLTATATGLSKATSSEFDITAGPATQLAFTVQPTTTTAGRLISPAVKVSAQDALGNVVPSFTENVTVTLTAGTAPTAVTLAGATGVPAVNGVAVFGTLSINKSGTGYTLAATATGLAAATSAPFDITPGTATHLGFTVQPTTTTAGAVIAPAVQVAALDASGNTVPSFTGTVTVALGGSNPSGATLAGTKTVAAVNGVASFATLSIDKSAGYWLTAAATGLSGAASSDFTITPGPATRLAFTTQPTATTAGRQISPAVKVTAQDALGNAASDFTGTVTVALGVNPGGSTLTGTTAVAAANGVATFYTLSLDKTGTGYTLTAASTGLTGATSAPFDVTPGTATHLGFTVQPTSTTAGAVITPVVQVAALDASGNTVPSFTGMVTVALGGSNPSGATLGGTTTGAAVNGVASFATLSVDKSATGYWLTAAATGLSKATSTAFDVSAGTATQLVFTAQPSNTVAGRPISPAVQVSARDAQGNVATGFTGGVTVALGVNPSGGTLAGTTTVVAVNGVASFATLSVDKVGAGYTLTAAAAGLSGATSGSFSITPGTVSRLAFTAQPTSTTAGVTITPAVQVTGLDASGNVATGFTGTVTLAIGKNAGGGTLAGTTAVTAVAGVATFSDLSINKGGTGYTMTAGAASGLTGATSAPFDITAGAATQLVFTGQPSTATAGAVITPAVQVTAQDALGNTVPSFTGTVTVALTAGTGTSGATLAGTTTVAAVAGVASFATLSVNRSGTGYTLTATAPGLSGATSAAFNITAGPATQLVFTGQPSSARAARTISPAVQVTAQDALGNVVPGFTGTVTVALGTNPSGATLAGTTMVAAVGGVATFGNLSVDKVGAGYTLTAAAAGLSGATSSAFDITAGGASQFAFTTQPTSTTAGAVLTPAVQVTALDAGGNVATGFTGTVAVALGANPGGGTLSGTTTVTAVAGVASFATLSIDKAGTGYTLTAAAPFQPTLTGTTSAPFDITPGAATQLVFTGQPSSATAGATLTPAVQVTARDALGNPVPGFTGAVTVALGANPGGGTLAGTTTVAAVNGVASFATLSVNRSGTGYTLTATTPGLGGATSAAFTITAGPAAQLAFTGPPGTTTAGQPITPAVQVTAQDALGNVVAGFTGTVTVALGANPSGGTLGGTTMVAAVAGVATFATLSIDKSGTGYTLTAAMTGLSGATSAAFNIIAGAISATQSTVVAAPTVVTAGSGAATITVTARDANGNPVSGAVVVLTATGSGNTLTQPAAPTDGNGVATGSFSSTVAGSKTVTAAIAGVTLTETAALTVTAGPVSQLAFTGQPTPTTAGQPLAPAVQVTARDGFGNTVPSFTGTVTVALTAGTGTSGATLGGTTTVAAVAGVASFATLSIDKSGTGYTLTAAAPGLSGATSAAFNITAGPAAQLAFTVQPGTTTAGQPIAPAVQVAARDALGNVVPGFTGTVTVALGANPGGGTLAGTTTVAVVGGVATFGNLSVDKVGTGYTLTAAAAGLSGAASTAFNITAGSATQLVFTGQPTSTGAGAVLTPAVQVTALDARGNTVPGFTGNMTVAITAGTGAGGAVLSGTRTAAAIGGVATFSTLSLDRSGTGYTLSATATGLTGSTSAAFDITAGAATQLVFTVQPSTTTAGETIQPAVQVTAQDALGNPVPGFTGDVTVTITAGTGTSGATLSGTTVVAAGAGIATFSTLSIDRAGTVSSGTGYTLSARTSGLTGATSDPFDIKVGPASRLVFTIQPTTTTAGAHVAPPVQVTALDGVGNTVPGFTGTVTVAIGTNPASGTLSGTTTVAAVAGVATFATLSIDRTGTGYTLSAAATGLSSATSAAFDIAAGLATQLVFTVQPSTATAGATFSPAVRVTARDALGNTAAGFIGNVTVAIGTNPTGGTLGGMRTLAAVAGVATFSTLSIDQAGSGYTLTAAAGGLTGATSALFDIIPSTATRLLFTVQPSTASAGVALTPAVQVTAVDASGNIVPSFTDNVTVAIGTNPAGGTLSGATTVAAVNGVASFSSLSIDRSGSGYALTAAAVGLVGAASAPFDITAGAATQLVFTVHPSTVTAGARITPQVEVTARDGLGNTATGYTGTVAVAIGTNPAGGTLSGTATVAAVVGVAAFSNLSIDKAGSGYTLSSAATGLTGASSTSFDVSAAPATQLAFAVQPTSTMAGATINPAVQLVARDALGNAVTGFTGAVTLTITAGTGTSGARLSGTTTVAAVAGVATFSTLSIDQTGSGYTLSATATGVAGTTSSTFTITAGSATHLVFTAQPSTATAGATITPAVRVTARDALGNLVPGFTGSVTVAIGTNPAGGTLFGTTAVVAVDGVATFSTLTVDKTGTGYTLSAMAAGLTAATSAPFNITAGAPAQLVFTVQPGTTTAGTRITPQVEVTARDGLGNTATGYTGNITVAIASNPAGGTLAGAATVAAVAGVAAFSDLSIDKAGSGYTLSATAAGLTGAASAVFTIAPGSATQLLFTVQPTTAASGGTIRPAVRVTARDALGNTATGFMGNVTVAIGTNPASGILSGTRTFAAIAGVATFSSLEIDKVGSGYTLTATAGGLTGATSAPFDIIPSTASKLVFTAEPTDSQTAGAVITPALQVTAQDASGSKVTGFTGNMTVAIVPGTGVSGATLSGTTTVAAVGGVGTFSDLSIDKSGAWYTLSVTATGVPGSTITAFRVIPGPATELVFRVQPSTATAGATITPQVEVSTRDGLGNTATNFTGNVTVAIGNNPGGGTLSGTTTVSAAVGVAAFRSLSIDQAGSGYTLSAAAPGLPGATSVPFDVTATRASQLVFTAQPISTTAGVTISPAVAVTAHDASGQTATGFTGNVTLTITAGTGATKATLLGTTTVAAVNGVATFSNLEIDQSGSAYRLSATATGLAGTTSSFFSINPGAPTQLTFTPQRIPAQIDAPSPTAGATITPPIPVVARDALGNTVETYAGDVTVAIATNPGGGALSGTTTVAALAGVATFNDLSVDRTGTGYQLQATASGLSSALSNGFVVTAGPATQLLFTVQPSATTAGGTMKPAVRVTAFDALGNLAAGFMGDVTVAITAGTGTGGAVLLGTTTVTAVNGVAVFSTLSIDRVGSGYALSATATGLTGATSTLFDIN